MALRVGTHTNPIRNPFHDLTRAHKVRLYEGMYGITWKDARTTHVQSAAVLLEGGLKIVQYRPKAYTSFDHLKAEALEIKRLCAQHKAILIINDDVALARLVDADGVHLGQKDMAIEDARRQYGDWLEGKMIGISAATPAQAVAAHNAKADYIGVGPVHSSKTKTDEPEIGMGGLQAISKALEEIGSEMGIVAIGGLTISDIPTVKKFSDGMAVISPISDSPNRAEAAREFVEAWEKTEV